MPWHFPSISTRYKQTCPNGRTRPRLRPKARCEPAPRSPGQWTRPAKALAASQTSGDCVHRPGVALARSPRGRQEADPSSGARFHEFAELCASASPRTRTSNLSTARCPSADDPGVRARRPRGEESASNGPDQRLRFVKVRPASPTPSSSTMPGSGTGLGSTLNTPLSAAESPALSWKRRVSSISDVVPTPTDS